MKFNRKELYSAGLMLFIGIITTVGSLNYDVRTLARMGPGYFPLMLGVGLIIVALLILFSSAETAGSAEAGDEIDDGLGKPHYRAWGLVTLGVVLFIILGKYGGLVPATFVLVFVSALADRANTVAASLMLAGAMTAFAIAVFHYGLQMQFPLFTWG